MRDLSKTSEADAGAIRAELRRKGETGLGCGLCVHYRECGGTQAEGQCDCFSCMGPGCAVCDLACPYAGDFAGRMFDVGGLVFPVPQDLRQARLTFPAYVPVLYHPYKRSEELALPVAALPFYSLFKLSGGTYRTIVDDPDELRRKFLLKPGTRIVLRGTDRDHPLETYWKYRRRDGAAQQIARLGVTAVIAPNFSHFLDVPRTDNLYNRKRQLICIEELAVAGLTVIPHLSARHADYEPDWRFWLEMLRADSRLHVVAVEFQTGNKNLREGQKVIAHLRRIQDELGRPIHPVLIGGRRLSQRYAQHFAELTVMDGRPFMNAMNRRMFDARRGKWLKVPTMEWASLDRHLATNIKQYTFWIEQGQRAARMAGGARVA